MNIRPAIVEDLPVLYSFEQGIVAAERPFDSTLKNGEIHYYDLKQLIESSDSVVMIAEEAGEIIGSGYAEIRNAKDYLQYSRYVHLGFMYTLPTARGKGVNKAIVESLVNWSRSKGINEVRLEVYRQNDVAKKAYEKIGFKELLVEMRLDLTEQGDS